MAADMDKEPIEFVFTNSTMPKVDPFKLEIDELDPDSPIPLDDARYFLMEQLKVPESQYNELKNNIKFMIPPSENNDEN